MSEVNCLYCGERIPADVASCPACGSPSHFQQQGFRLAGQRNFTVLFTVIAITCMILVIALPR
jgi:predicted amidophosphoribosyltransferase